jgi:hypothetical protein
MKPDETRLTLELAADISWIPVLQGVVESSAPILGLDDKKALRLSMACEEILAHLSGWSPGIGVKISVTRLPAQMAVAFEFQGDAADLWAMNLTAAKEISTDPEKGMAQMGLLLASRMVDHYAISLTGGGLVRITLFQNRSYPMISPFDTLPEDLKGPVQIHENPDPAVLSQACARVLSRYAATLYPASFTTPGKVVDLIAGGRFDMAVAMDAMGTVAGVIGWERVSEKTTRFYGPYVCAGESEKISRLLVDHLINRSARTSSVILYSDMTTPALPAGDFEILGELKARGTDSPVETKTTWFRLLREDTGCRVWAHPDMVTFLENTYERLFLVRTIQPYSHSGEQRPARSLFGTSLDKSTGRAMLRPMLDGTDISENIRHHLRYLQADGFDQILFSLDLSESWQAAMGGDLTAQGFSPAYVLPYAGNSDKVIFQYATPAH